MFQAKDAGKFTKQPSECKKNHKKVANSRQQKLSEPQADPSRTNDGGKFCWKGIISLLLY